MPESGIAGSYDKFNFLRNRQTVLQRGCTIVHFHQHWMTVTVSPHLYQHLAMSSFFITAMLVGSFSFHFPNG